MRKLVSPAHEFFHVVASCGLLPRTTRPGPRLRTAFWSVAILPLRDTRASWTWSAPLTECSVILSLRAKSKDPHLVASSAWVADPSQAQDDSQPVEDPKRTGRCAKLAGVRARWTGDQARRLRVSRSGRIATGGKGVRTRGPGRGVLRSKPRVATSEKVV